MASKYIPSDWRQRKLSDERLKYCIDMNNRIIHYKTCDLVRSLQDDNISFISDYRQALQQCPKCAIKSYVTAFAKDPENLKRYEKAFSEMGATHKVVRKMYIDCDIRTQKVSDGIKMFRSGECWKIIAGGEKGHIRLFHHNYKVVDGKKVFVDGYHEQIKTRSKQNIDSILKQIVGYDYSTHCLNRAVTRVHGFYIYVKPSTYDSWLGKVYIWIGDKLNLLTSVTI